MKTIVIGAAGWLGRAVLENLRGRHEIRAFDLGPEAWKAWGETDGAWDPGDTGEVIHGQITDFATVDRAMEGVDGVIHTAAYFGGAELGLEVEDDDGSWLSFEAFYLKPPPGGRIVVWAEEEKVARRAYCVGTQKIDVHNVSHACVRPESWLWD